ncbi:MAG TPA: hypothetical protein VME40_15885 [Caulobacteraceae bacterium]|nr:hypothetical protein [Caulobacteraceae bacterium]
MDDQFPPWKPDSSESVASDQSSFHDCDQVVSGFASKMNGAATSRQYTTSKQWGDVLRAKVVSPSDANGAGTLITCWSCSGANAEFVVQTEGYQ